MNEILDYITHLYKQGLQHRTINNHRSSISAFHKQVQGKPIREHPRVCTLVGGTFNSSFPESKYCFIWNIETVMEFIRKECGSNQEIYGKFLTYELTMLMALTSAFRSLDIRFKAKAPSSFTFIFHKLHKAWKKGKSQPSVVSFWR